MKKHPSLPTFFGWKTLVSAWAIFGSYMACQDYVVAINQGQPALWSRVLPEELLYAACWALLTPLIFFLTGRFPIGRGRLVRRAGLHLVLSVCVSLVQRTLYGMTFDLYRVLFLGGTFSWERFSANLLSFVDYGMLLYWLLLLIGHAVESARTLREKELRASQLETQLSRAQLQALKMQLHPHFLFNTLNAISVLIKKDPDAARATVARLSDLLRIALEGGTSHEVTLASEMRFLTRYLEIEKTRFGDRLSASFDVAPQIRGAYIPGMILQPLVENAIKHGVAKRRGSSSIVVAARKEHDILCLSVWNEGPRMASPKGNTVTEGVGLANTRSRLRQLYGDSANLSVRNRDRGGVIAEITLPFTTNGTREDEASDG